MRFSNGHILLPFWPSNNPHPLLDSKEIPTGPQGLSRGDIQNLLNKNIHRYKDKNCSPWIASFRELPAVVPSLLDFKGDEIQIGQASDFFGFNRQEDQKKLLEHLHLMKPWRKGPFNLFGIQLDAEWQSQLKWNRVAPHLENLSGSKILDIGANSGYYMYRLLAHRPAWVLGIDPSFRFKIQFETLQYYTRCDNLFYETIGMEDLSHFPEYFDHIFCMGILYHRKSPDLALKLLRNTLAPGGTLFLETLVLEGKEKIVLSPYPTYSKMKNVYFIPTLSALEEWLDDAGFTSAQLLDINQTSITEQRNTEFCPLPAESLSHFLNPTNPRETIEGYPAPTRALYKLSMG